MKIIIDGDACPSIPLIESKAKEFQVEVMILCDINHMIYSEYSTVRIVDSGFQSVDMYIVNIVEKGDIVISKDYGVACMCLDKAGAVLNPKGYIYEKDNIDRLLLERHNSQKLRRGGYKTSNPRKRTKEDDIRLLKNLEKNIIRYKN